MRQLEEEKRVIKVLADEIKKSPQKTILCAKIKGELGYLKSADISDEVFYGMKLKNWLTSFFSKEFYLTMINGGEHLFYIGHDYPEARTPAVVGEIIKNYLNHKGIPESSVSEIDNYMQTDLGLSLAEFCNATDPAKWLEQNFPELIVIGNKIRLKKDTPVAVPISNPEQEMLSAFVLLGGFNKSAKDVCEKLGIFLSVLDVKSKVASDFARMLIQGNCWSGQYDEKQILAFPVSLTESKTVYCVLTENDREHSIGIFTILLYIRMQTIQTRFMSGCIRKLKT